MSDCSLCGESLCKHGFCTNRGDIRGRGACPASRDANGWYCQGCAEDQHQRQIEEFYGGNGPATDSERLMAAALEKRRIG